MGPPGSIQLHRMVSWVRRLLQRISKNPAEPWALQVGMLYIERWYKKDTMPSRKNGAGYSRVLLRCKRSGRKPDSMSAIYCLWKWRSKKLEIERDSFLWRIQFRSYEASLHAWRIRTVFSWDQLHFPQWCFPWRWHSCLLLPALSAWESTGRSSIWFLYW